MSKSIITEGIEDAVKFNRSPFVEGFQQGVKAALIGAPAGALIQALRGKNPILGAIIGGAIPGIISGASAAAAKKLQNIDQEAMIRYHTEKIKEREPMFFMPPPNKLRGVFAKGFNDVY